MLAFHDDIIPLYVVVVGFIKYQPAPSEGEREDAICGVLVVLELKGNEGALFQRNDMISRLKLRNSVMMFRFVGNLAKFCVDSALTILLFHSSSKNYRIR
ncbi:hypothetical protein [Paenibacillus sp. Soil750]|uniref:hypothetical protein n=1 Tax=Paenibacillus sp. Soil750 TaxID=1736398 RepID=UPI0007020810|nr:hypothetical protein [Paenibacillus sp. Soil750]KRE68824.1 hypothetical protein ASL11_18050 [Paenibacillus sp. Soil750]